MQEHLEARTDYENWEDERRMREFNEELDEVVAQWSSIDIEIGQALRGQRGVTAVAQIEVLSSLKEGDQVWVEWRGYGESFLYSNPYKLISFTGYLVTRAS